MSSSSSSSSSSLAPSAAIDAWQQRWNELEANPHQMWKSHEKHRFDLFHASLLGGDAQRIVVPMAGDCLAVKTFAVERQCSVAAIEFVPRACERLQERFADTDVAFDSVVPLRDNVALRCGTSASTGAQVRIFQCDVLDPQPELADWADVLYDKDAFGALQPAMRAPYVALMTTYLKAGGIVLLAGASRVIDVDKGPPFSLTRELVQAQWCATGAFEIVGEPRERVYNVTEDERFHDITYVLKKVAVSNRIEDAEATNTNKL
jgi:hypothetical protein